MEILNWIGDNWGAILAALGLVAALLRVLKLTKAARVLTVAIEQGSKLTPDHVKTIKGLVKQFGDKGTEKTLKKFVIEAEKKTYGPRGK